MRQIDAADGAPIDWYFMDETSMNATKNYSMKKELMVSILF